MLRKFAPLVTLVFLAVSGLLDAGPMSPIPAAAQVPSPPALQTPLIPSAPTAYGMYMGRYCSMPSREGFALFAWHPAPWTTQQGTTLSWSLPPGHVQWLDLSLTNSGFLPGTFASVGPLPPSETSFMWRGLTPGLTYYWRVNTFHGFYWAPSETYYFDLGCPP